MDDRFDWFDADVAIRRNADGEVRVYRCREARDKGKTEWSDYIWSDGNFACDCNRYDFFERAGGREPEDEESENVPCGDTAFTILSIKDVETGELLYSENPTAS